jgi:hypothetical protein
MLLQSVNVWNHGITNGGCMDEAMSQYPHTITAAHNVWCVGRGDSYTVLLLINLLVS